MSTLSPRTGGGGGRGGLFVIGALGLRGGGWTTVVVGTMELFQFPFFSTRSMFYDIPNLNKLSLILLPGTAPLT